MTDRLPLGHVSVTPGDLSSVEQQVAQGIADRRRRTCIPLNLTKYVVSRRDTKLAAAINRADVVVADGVPIVWLARRLGWSDVHRVTGIDLAERLLARAQHENWSLYFLGASPEILDKAVQQVGQRFENPHIAGSRDGYFGDSDVPDIIKDINGAGPDILLLGLGMPQKEYFLADHWSQLDVRLCLTVGGAFDIWAGSKKRTPSAIQTMGLEWLYRSVYDLSRAGLIARYGVSFLKDLVLPSRKPSSGDTASE